MGSICSNPDAAKNDEKSEISLGTKAQTKNKSGKKSLNGSKGSKSDKTKASKKSEATKKVKKEKKKSKGASVTDVAQSTVETTQAGFKDDYDENDINTLFPDAPSSGKKLYQEAKEAVVFLDDLLNTADWKLTKETKDGLFLWKSKGGASTEMIVKRQTTVDASIESIADALMQVDTFTSVNERIDFLNIIENVNDDCQIQHQQMKGAVVLSARDLCVCHHLIHLKNGSKVVVRFSIEHSDVPEGKPVRAEIKAMFVLKSLSSSSTELTNVQKINMKGKIPGFIINKAADKQLEEFKNLRKYLEDN